MGIMVRGGCSIPRCSLVCLTWIKFILYEEYQGFLSSLGLDVGCVRFVDGGDVLRVLPSWDAVSEARAGVRLGMQHRDRGRLYFRARVAGDRERRRG